MTSFFPFCFDRLSTFDPELMEMDAFSLRSFFHFFLLDPIVVFCLSAYALNCIV